MLSSQTRTAEERPFARLVGPVSVTDIFSIGIGPSSSHTVGPMRAAFSFVAALGEDLDRCTELRVELYGSLALTGKGHCTDHAVLLGLSGWQPETIEPCAIATIVGLIRRTGELPLGGVRPIAFREPDHLMFRIRQLLPRHSNGMRFTAFAGNEPLLSRVYYSIGGGAIVTEDEANPAPDLVSNDRGPLPFSTAKALLDIGRQTNLSIADIVLVNELAWREAGETGAFLDRVRDAMMRSISRGCSQRGVLPGGLNVRRRAPGLYEKLSGTSDPNAPLRVMEWVSLFALAVNEENAAGGRVVTAPTNGAAGVIPAVLKYHETFSQAQAKRRRVRFF